MTKQDIIDIIVEWMDENNPRRCCDKCKYHFTFGQSHCPHCGEPTTWRKPKTCPTCHQPIENEKP